MKRVGQEGRLEGRNKKEGRRKARVEKRGGEETPRTAAPTGGDRNRKKGFTQI